MHWKPFELRVIEGPPVDWKPEVRIEGESDTMAEDVGWQSKASLPPALEVQEKLIAEHHLLSVAYLEAAIQCSRALALITIPGRGIGTGFMVSSDRLLTNNHVFASADEARGATIQFHFGRELDGTLLRGAEEYSTNPEVLFHTNSALDYSLVHVNGRPGDKWGFITLKDGVQLHDTEQVVIIQHLGGVEKGINLGGRIKYVDDTVAQYLTQSMPGASGSPVFNKAWDCVALHHSGGWFPQPLTQAESHLRNEGVLISAIVADLPT